MIVEMLGSPGAGKTSLLPAVREYFASQGQTAYSTIEAARPIAARTRIGKLVTRWLPKKLQRPILWQLFYADTRKYARVFESQYPELMQSVFNYQNQRPISASDRKHVLHWFIHLTGVVGFMTQHLTPDEILMIDEGFVHRVVQLFASEKEEPDWNQVIKYLDRIPKPDLIIYVSSPVELSVLRVFNRGLWRRFEIKSEEDTLRYLANAEAVVKFTAGILAKKGWPIIEVRNFDQSIETSRFQLRQSLAAWMSHTQELIPV